jgi:putative membrane protein
MPRMLAGHPWWTYWDPVAFMVGLAFVAVYLVAVTILRRRVAPEEPFTPGRLAWFLLGIALYECAFASPLDFISDEYLFSAHMIQHMLEMFVMTPVIYLGMPRWLQRWLLARTGLARVWSTAVNPVFALVSFMVVMDAFHLPALYNLTLARDAFHVFEHCLFFVVSVLMWWPVLSELPEWPRLGPSARLLYLFFNLDGMLLPSILIFMWESPLYPAYALAEPRLFGLSPLGDQRLGAVIMLGMSCISLAVAAVGAFGRWEAASWYE